MMDAAWTSSVRRLPAIQKRRWSGAGILVVVLAEFRRGVAAAQRYEALRYRGVCDGRVAPADVARRVFEEFYETCEPRLFRSNRPGCPLIGAPTRERR